MEKFAPTSVTPRLMTLKEAAIYLAISQDTLRRRVINHEIRVIRVGKGRNARWLFDRVKELDAWIERNNRKLGA